MTRDEIETFFEGRREAWWTRDAESLGACHAEDGIMESPMFGHRQGRRAITDSYKALFATFPDWDFKARSF